MDKISPLTAKVLAFSEVPDYDIDEAVSWAVEMLVLGYETPNLLILASLSKSDNYFEKVKYLRKACQEISLDFKTGEEGVISYNSFFIKEIFAGNQVRSNLFEIYKFCQAKNYANSILDFYLLYWAWDDFAYGESYSDYWADATPQNIESIVVQVAKDWLDIHHIDY